MTALFSFIVSCQIFGALVGAISTVWAEISYVRHARNGKIDHAERAHLSAIAHGLRFGMTLLLISSLALVIVAYLSRATVQPAVTTDYWILIVFALLIVYVSWALSRHRISFTLGSAIAFTAWWLLACLVLGFAPSISFGATIAFFVVATAVFSAILEYARLLAGVKR